MILANNVTPNELKEQQDQLLAAGSPISFRDLYNKQTDLPLHKRNYYKADDVDNLFVLINGVLSSVSENNYRSNEVIKTLREEIETLKSENETLKNSSEENINNENNSQLLLEQLSQKQEEFDKFSRDSFRSLEFLRGELSELSRENDEKDKLIAKYQKERILLADAIKKLKSK